MLSCFKFNFFKKHPAGNLLSGCRSRILGCSFMFRTTHIPRANTFLLISARNELCQTTFLLQKIDHLIHNSISLISSHNVVPFFSSCSLSRPLYRQPFSASSFKTVGPRIALALALRPRPPPSALALTLPLCTLRQPSPYEDPAEPPL